MRKTLYNSISKYSARKKYVAAAFVLGSVAVYGAFKGIRYASRRLAEKSENKKTLVDLLIDSECESHLYS